MCGARDREKSYDIMWMTTKNGFGIQPNPAANRPRLPPSQLGGRNYWELRWGCLKISTLEVMGEGENGYH